MAGQVELSKAVNKAIAKQSEERFTGRFTVMLEVNMAQGGIVDAFVESEITRTRVIGGRKNR